MSLFGFPTEISHTKLLFHLFSFSLDEPLVETVAVIVFAHVWSRTEETADDGRFAGPISGRQVPIFSYFFLFFSAYSYFSYFLAISSYFSYFLAILLTTSKYSLEI